MTKVAYIKKDVALSKIPTKYKPIIQDVKSAILHNFPDMIQNIYLYGSVATGKAKSPTSDLDILVVLKRKPTQEVSSRLKELSGSLSRKYKRNFREVGFAVTYRNEAIRGKESFALKFFTTILCVKIFGGRLYQYNSKFAVTKKLARSLNHDIGHSIEAAIIDIRSGSSKDAALKIKSIMRKIIRTAFNIVMQDENYWTTNLDEMAEIFIKYYPEHKKQMNAVLEMAKIDTRDTKKALALLKHFGMWVSNEFSAKCLS